MAGFALADSELLSHGLTGSRRAFKASSRCSPPTYRKAHVQYLIDALNTKFRAKGAPRFVQYVLLYGTELSRDRAVDAIIPNLMGGPPRLIAETLFSPRLVTVTVKTLTGRRFSLLLYPATEDVADIRDEIRFREGIPNEQQRLVLNGRQLEDGRSLADHGVKTECTLQLILKLRGGGGPGLKFADVYYEDTWLVELQLDSKVGYVRRRTQPRGRM